MTRLSKLRKRLARLRRRRRGVRWGTGYTALAVALLWVLSATFLVDWLLEIGRARLGMQLEMNRPERIVALVICAGVLVWVFRRFTRPWLGHRETELDMALLVERRQQIDSDLVAAIQFESPQAPEWGSVRLEQRVIDQTAKFGRRLDVMQGFSWKPLIWRTVVLSVTAAVLAVCVWQFPNHARAFLSRFFLLAPQHYPTRTVIETVQINGRRVEMTGWRPHVVKSPYGQPVRFEVTCSGRLPVAGHADLKANRGAETSVALSPAEERPNAYAGELPRLVEAVEYQILLGDAWTDPARIEVVPLPTIDVELEVTPPSYAAGGQTRTPTPAGLRQISVIEGSRVQVRITSDKVLKEAALSIDGRRFEMIRDESHTPLSGTATDCWTLATDNTPLARVLDPLRYEIRAVDMDDLEPERPTRGVIRIKADHEPRVVASAVTEFVLPAANPGVSYDASDDYGLARLSILPEVTHEDGRVDQPGEIVMYQLPEHESPLAEVRARYALDLAPLGLVKGDELKITLQAVDYRGRAQEGKATLSEPLLFQVTDERGILAAMAETDRESAGRLKTMIQRQIEVGEGQ